MTIRPVFVTDRWTLLSWANDPDTRANSFHQHRINEAEHYNWLQQQLGSPNIRGWLLEDNGVAVAVAWYRRVESSADVSVTVAPEHRGKGYGVAILAQSAAMALRALRVDKLRALCFVDNAASVKAFERAGYERLGKECVVLERCAT